ncbi:Hypothetical predicted protein [Pelobates cultripes]|uniref:Uncharacterized protein n=1 Tax=Pelobates cultripes TaxID=61616 RepID=A0AAD1RNI2_PELCU|nr:Hypothetical predicted protein [Pelobates cultripes]
MQSIFQACHTVGESYMFLCKLLCEYGSVKLGLTGRHRLILHRLHATGEVDARAYGIGSGASYSSSPEEQEGDLCGGATITGSLTPIGRDFGVFFPMLTGGGSVTYYDGCSLRPPLPVIIIAADMAAIEKNIILCYVMDIGSTLPTFS